MCVNSDHPVSAPYDSIPAFPLRFFVYFLHPSFFHPGRIVSGAGAQRLVNNAVFDFLRHTAGKKRKGILPLVNHKCIGN